MKRLKKENEKLRKDHEDLKKENKEQKKRQTITNWLSFKKIAGIKI